MPSAIITVNYKGIMFALTMETHVGIVSINSTSNYKIAEASESENKSLASGVILSPKGTILHGNLSSDVEKRPRIKIYYTEPED